MTIKQKTLNLIFSSLKLDDDAHVCLTGDHVLILHENSFLDLTSLLRLRNAQLPSNDLYTVELAIGNVFWVVPQVPGVGAIVHQAKLVSVFVLRQEVDKRLTLSPVVSDVIHRVANKLYKPVGMDVQLHLIAIHAEIDAVQHILQWVHTAVHHQRIAY